MIIYENLLYNQDIAHVTEIKFPWYKLQNRSIMISGATGLIGSFLIDVLLEKNTQDGLNCTVMLWDVTKRKLWKDSRSMQITPILYLSHMM